MSKELEGFLKLPPTERRKILAQGNPQLAQALYELTRLESNILIIQGQLENLEDYKNRLEQSIYKLAAAQKKAEAEQPTDPSLESP